MKVYILPNRVTLVGKAWEIRQTLKRYDKQYKTVHDWIVDKKKKTT
ncbi:Z-ring formation inhibitor MciZ [Bacillus manliponensis]|uniref:PadR family transcriptional regulator n=1 Tax=Bacillus manliponensis TaxID=574376 RepID=A0A073K3M5_9BACI|nr:Z-ring formation inhibitor MciZ [Bacillus manliponensis]KEK21085.1 PadR family transcriptional regulator [Bacillus manliponensis]